MRKEQNSEKGYIHELKTRLETKQQEGRRADGGFDLWSGTKIQQVTHYVIK